jgi:hypothetical protein
MSTQTYRDQVTKIVSELASLESKHAKAREDAARERSAAGRAMTSINKNSSPTTVQSRLREAERHDARAVAHDKEAGRIAGVIASKQRARSETERRLEGAEAADRRKIASDADRRRRADLRHVESLEKAHRATVGPVPWPYSSPAFIGTRFPVNVRSVDEPAPRRGRGRPPWTAQLFWARYREAVAQVKPPHTYDAVAPHFERLDGSVGTTPDFLRKLVGRFGLPADKTTE